MHFNLNYTPHFHVGLLNSSLQEKKVFMRRVLLCFGARGRNLGAAVDEAVNNAWADCPLAVLRVWKRSALGCKGGCLAAGSTFLMSPFSSDRCKTCPSR